MPYKNTYFLVGGLVILIIVTGAIVWRGIAFGPSPYAGHTMMLHGLGMNRDSTTSSVNRSITGLQNARPQELTTLQNGQSYPIEAAFIKNTVAGRTIRMLAYNSQIPGPILKVTQGDTITVHFKNSLDENTTIHWHGIRVENKFDGVPDETQPPVKPGESFTYQVTFPDPGLYWYHPHTREDYEQELGMYGLIWVEPKDPSYFSPVNRQEFLILDDVLLGQNDVIMFGMDQANFALMGRYGNTLFINGKDKYNLTVKKGEVVRFATVNTANARPFRVAVPGAKIKLVGGDSGRYNRETFVDSVTLSPSERALIDILFDQSGTFELLNKTPTETTLLGTIIVGREAATADYTAEFNDLRTNQLAEATLLLQEYQGKTPDHTINLTVDMHGMGGVNHGTMPHPTTMDGIEWDDTMGTMNAQSTSRMLKWIIQDAVTQKENMEARYIFKRKEAVKIRIFNNPNSMHPMQHPIHFHGNRFLVLAVNGEQTTNPVWKDTVLVPSGATVDILLDASNPGTWMAHCHIAEHLQANMIINYTVE